MPSNETAAWVGRAGLPALKLPLGPEINELETAFWSGGQDGGLYLQRCHTCGAWAHPPFPRCRVCKSEDVGPQRASGRGTVYSFTVNHQPWAPDLAVPYIIAVVAPEEAPELRLYTNIVEAGVDEIKIGMPVEVDPVDVGDGVWLPVFRLRRSEQV
ncbi:Zn-ribbon domain-containing OB-fold protein [Nocardia fusca]|uniref:Zn-ribbon domain-containing OB-fold protein n=1 Tax=Nocardia fusca TaxID=941183 RepID=UPI0037B7EAE4